MTPEEKKAKELVDRFYEVDTISADHMSSASIDAEQCALITVDEIIKVYESLDEDADTMFKTEIEFYQKVKQIIEKS